MKLSARRHVDAMTTPGKASDFIQPYKNLPPGLPIVLAVRVSEVEQERNGNSLDQERHYVPIFEGDGHPVIAVVHGETKINGKWRQHASGWDPWWLWKAAAIARRHGAVIVAATTDRLVRNLLYRSDDKRLRRLRATQAQLEELADIVNGVPLYTYVDPDLPMEGEDGAQSEHVKRGQAAKGNKGGRPKKKESPGARRSRLLLMAIKMQESGCANVEIAEAIVVPKETVRRWLKYKTHFLQRQAAVPLSDRAKNGTKNR